MSTVTIYGKHAVLSALENPNRMNKKIIITPELHKKLSSTLLLYNIKIEFKHLKELDAITSNGVHQGIALQTSSVFIEGLSKHEDFLHKEKSCVLILDQISDPQNVGAIIRSAAAFGADAVIIQKDNAPNETGSMSKASAGGIEKVKIIKVVNLSQAMELLKEKNYWIVGLDGATDKSINKLEFTPKTVLVLGSEGEGMRQRIKTSCDFIVKIPNSEQVESLNVATAAAIGMYEYFTAF